MNEDFSQFLSNLPDHGTANLGSCKLYKNDKLQRVEYRTGDFLKAWLSYSALVKSDDLDKTLERWLRSVNNFSS